MSTSWEKGRGKLGPMQPLLGRWVANGETPMGPVRCTREFELILGKSVIQLRARWEFSGSEPGKAYEELALIRATEDGPLGFWSFTSDGKHSTGLWTDVTDLHPEAIGFEAQMPAGTARMAYWPDEADGFHWIVDSKTKKGWNRMVTHHYKPIP